MNEFMVVMSAALITVCICTSVKALNLEDSILYMCTSIRHKYNFADVSIPQLIK